MMQRHMSSERIIETEIHEASRSSPSIWKLSLTIAAILIAWGLSTWMRLDWIEISKAKPETQWGNSFLPTTHDSYLFASVIKQDSKKSQPQEKLKLHPSSKQYGPLTLLGVICSKYIGIPVEKYVTYAPIYFAGLLAIPMVLLGRLYGSIFMGFFGACLAVAGSSYFNRTMAGYLDTDIFAVTIPAFITYFFLRAHKEESTGCLAIGAVTAFIYPFFYAPGATIVTAVNLCYIGFKTANWLISRKCISEKSKCFSLRSSSSLMCESIRQ